MSAIDWTIIAVYLVWVIWDGIRLSKHTNEIEGYFLASRSLPWWAVGLSVMATQLSAITMIGTTGQGYAVEAVVPKAQINVLIPALKDAGATDLLEIPISKIVH